MSSNNVSSNASSIVSNVFGTLGAICWSVQLLPQIILNYRRHSAAGLSPSFMLCWAAAGIPLGVYNIVQHFNVALQVQPQILTTLSLFTWAQCAYYERRWTLLRAMLVALLIAAFMAAVEVGLVFAVRIALNRGTEWPATLLAALAAFLLALGVFEQYIAIWKNKSVEGISFLFCGIDALGDVTSIISVCFEPHLSILGLVTYSVEFLLWLGVFACGAYFKLIPWTRSKVGRARRRREVPAADAGVTLQDLPSSTSVFHTAEGEVQIRSRRQNLPL